MVACRAGGFAEVLGVLGEGVRGLIRWGLVVLGGAGWGVLDHALTCENLTGFEFVFDDEAAQAGR